MLLALPAISAAQEPTTSLMEDGAACESLLGSRFYSSGRSPFVSAGGESIFRHLRVVSCNEVSVF